MASTHSKLGLVFTILSILVGGLMVACGIYIFVNSFWRHITSFVIGCYYILFGALIVLFEIVHIPQVQTFFAFYYYYIGKGLLFIFFGFLIVADSGFFLFAGIVILVVGTLLCIMHFILARPSPLIKRDYDPHRHNHNHNHNQNQNHNEQKNNP